MNLFAVLSNKALAYRPLADFDLVGRGEKGEEGMIRGAINRKKGKQK